MPGMSRRDFFLRLACMFSGMVRPGFQLVQFTVYDIQKRCILSRSSWMWISREKLEFLASMAAPLRLPR